MGLTKTLKPEVGYYTYEAMKPAIRERLSNFHASKNYIENAHNVYFSSFQNGGAA